MSLNWQEKRSEVREKSTKGKYLRSSLQCLSNDEVLLLLESILQRSKDGTQRNYTAKGLRAVQEHLMYGYGYLDLEEAYHLFSSFNELSCPDKQAFRDKLLDPDHFFFFFFFFNETLLQHRHTTYNTKASLLQKTKNKNKNKLYYIQYYCLRHYLLCEN